MLRRGAFAIPPAPMALTIAGLMPFFGAAFVILAAAGEPIRIAQAKLVLLAYAAVILSFLGGVRWGAEIATATFDPPRTHVLALSVIGALAGWGIVLYEVLGQQFPGLLLVAASLLALHGVWDIAQSSRLPEWYDGLRLLASAGAALALGVAWVFTRFPV